MTSVINYEVFGHYAAITASDTAAFAECDAIFVGSAGNATIVRADGTAVVFQGLQAGQVLPVKAIRVNTTNLTAGQLVALYRRAP
jgi:hypothetical protein